MPSEIFSLCWFPRLAIQRVSVVLDLDQMLDQANQGHDGSLANLVRLNWMVSHMRDNGMLKPIWCCGDDHTVIVGDTRIMAARLLGIDEVRAFVYLRPAQGHVCGSQAEILSLAGFGTDSRLHYRGTTDILTMPPAWVEIEHESTAGHGHDAAALLDAMRQHLQHNPGAITKSWVVTPHQWPGLFW